MYCIGHPHTKGGLAISVVTFQNGEQLGKVSSETKCGLPSIDTAIAVLKKKSTFLKTTPKYLVSIRQMDLFLRC